MFNLFIVGRLFPARLQFDRVDKFPRAKKRSATGNSAKMEAAGMSPCGLWFDGSNCNCIGRMSWGFPVTRTSARETVGYRKQKQGMYRVFRRLTSSSPRGTWDNYSSRSPAQTGDSSHRLTLPWR